MKKSLMLMLLFLALSITASADTIVISGDGEQWIGGTPIGGGTGSTQAIERYPAWQQNNPDGTNAVWVSYADTGWKQGTLAPPNGSLANPDGTAVIMTVWERFWAGPGDTLSLKVWADDTARVGIDGKTVFGENLTQSVCADGPIGCQSSEFGLVNYTFTTSGLHLLTFDVFQVGRDTEADVNPFGLLYAGGVTSVPEPSSLLLLGIGLVGLCLALAWCRWQL
jgi:hypothetical protein